MLKYDDTVTLSDRGNFSETSTYHSSVRVVGVRPENKPRRHVHRVSSDFLQQGGVIDSFGNKSVKHQHWDGDVIATPADGRRLPKIDRFASTEGRWHLPPRGVITWSNQDYGIVFPGQYATASYFRGSSTLECFACTCVINAAGKPMVCHGEASVTQNSWDRSFGFSAYPSDASTSVTTAKWRRLYPTERHALTDRMSAHELRARYEAELLGAAVDIAHAAASSGALTTTNYTTTIPLKQRTLIAGSMDELEHALYMEYEPELTYHWKTNELSAHTRDVIHGFDDFSSNGLAYIHDLKSIGSTLRTLVGIAAGGSITPRDAASAWLSGRYGDRLTIQDTRELLEGVQRALRRRGPYTVSRRILSSSATSPVKGLPISARRASTVICRPGSNTGLMKAVDSLMAWDIWPTLENVWDLVPFSFVVDWFISVSSILDQIDAAVRGPYLRPVSQYASDRLSMPVTIENRSDLPLANLTFVRYARGRYDVLSDIHPFEDTPTDSRFGVVQLGDAVALAVQLLYS